MSGSSNTSAPPATLTGILISQSIACLVCVGVPILVTLMAPVTTVEFRRDKAVTATVTRYVLLFIPWKTEHVTGVTDARAEVMATRYKPTKEERRRGDTGTKLSTGQIVLVNATSETIVQAAPEIAEPLANEMTAFLTQSNPAPLRKTIYASWSLTYLLGGAMTGLCAFYLVCVVLAIVTAPLRLLKSVTPTTSIDPSTEH